MKKWLQWRFDIKGNAPPPCVGTAQPYGCFNTSQQGEWGKWFEKWFRRSITYTGFTLAFVLVVLLSPVLLPLSLGFDSVTNRDFPYTRILLFFLLYLFNEMLAIYVFGLGLYLTSVLFGWDQQQWRTWVFTLQHIWGARLLAGPCLKVMGLRVCAEGVEHVKRSDNGTQKASSSLKERPFLMFMRHNSTGDTLLPQYFFSDQFRMRYILKKELCWDAGLDTMGSRTPNFFLSRMAGPKAMSLELKAMQDLLSDYNDPAAANIITCIWPEGTRFESKKRERILQKLRGEVEMNDKTEKKEDEEQVMSAEEMLRRTEALKHTLPPRLGGALALLEKNASLLSSSRRTKEDWDRSTSQQKEEDIAADILFCAHTGFELARSFWDLKNGRLVGETIYVKFWRVPFEQVPTTPLERSRWLFDQWQEMDQWIDEKIQQRRHPHHKHHHHGDVETQAKGTLNSKNKAGRGGGAGC
ncbi:PlsC domain-containing protein [Balamuthia mandrillaris]